MLLAWIIGVSLLSLVLSLGGAALVLLAPEDMRKRTVPSLVAYATGALLGAAFLGMLPAAVTAMDPRIALQTVLVGVVLFFVLEKIVLWRHCHDQECPDVHGRAAPLILIGDAFHNFVDGAVIASAFIAGTGVGLTTALAVIAHELPQELGDFAILLDSGYSRSRALLWNVISGSPVVLGGVLAWLVFARVQGAIPYALAIAAASFIYIAAADLIPDLHRRAGWAASLRQSVLLLAGIGTIFVLRHLH
jgi:zinc and cadmium transporter